MQSLLGHLKTVAKLYEILASNTGNQADADRAEMFFTAALQLEARDGGEEIPGAPTAVKIVIDEFLLKGTSTRYEVLVHKFEPSLLAFVDEMRGIRGFDLRTLIALWEDGYGSLRDVWSGLPERGLERHECTEAQHIGIIFRHHLAPPMAHASAAKCAEAVLAVLAGLAVEGSPTQAPRAFVGGALARREASVGTIEIVVVNDAGVSIPALVDQLKAGGVHAATLQSGAQSARVVVWVQGALAREVASSLANEADFAAATLHHTGPRLFNVLLQERAAAAGYRLAEKGLFHYEKRVSATSEEEIFALLGVKYVPPEKRSRTVAFAASSPGRAKAAF